MRPGPSPKFWVGVINAHLIMLLAGLLVGAIFWL